MLDLRDIFVTLVVFGSVPFILKRPWIGIIIWAWLGYMNPHKLSWGFARDMPFAQIVAITTVLALLLSKESKKIPWTRETVVLLIFIVWMFITTVFSLLPEFAWPQMEKVAKIQFMTFLTLILITSRDRLQLLVWVIALSLSFYGVKGGIFTLLGGGTDAVMGPEGTFIGQNNEIGLALIMTVPLLRYLQLSTDKAWLRRGIMAAIVLTAIAIVGTQSRGALVGITAMGLFLWLKSPGKGKFFTAVLLAGVAFLIVNIMPEKWYDRMATIQTYEADRSAMGRINSWGFAFNLAKGRALGGGYECFQSEIFSQYAPNPADVHDAHSIYFEVLGEHGFIGLALFLALGLMTWRTGSWVIKTARDDPDKKWAGDLASMIQVSMVGYATGGAFLGLAYFDFYYHLVVMIVLCKVILLKQAGLQGQSVATGAWQSAGSISIGTKKT
ncbi:MAG: putative O-glycosylation ligase, exosortase A system-associated [Burkholderiales bacterium]